jgi:hypothetical protein
MFLVFGNLESWDILMAPRRDHHVICVMYIDPLFQRPELYAFYTKEDGSSQDNPDLWIFAYVVIE